jgi:predicted dehydrogenase
MTNSSPIAVGIIGCGSIANAYFNACKRFPFLTVSACADLRIEAAEKRAAEFGCRALTVEALLADPDIQIVINLTIPQAHAEIDLRILEAGKHAFSEKPFALTRAEGEAVVARAAELGLRVGCAPDTCLGAGVQTCRKLIDDGEIGTPVAFQANMICGGHESWHPSPEFYYKRGGGPMFDMGPYYLHTLITLLGPVKRVSGLTRTSFPTRTITSQPKRGTVVEVEIPTHIVATLEFANGVIGQLTTSFDVKHGANSPAIEIYGTDGSLSVPDPNGTGGAVKLRTGKFTDWVQVKHTHPYVEGSRGVGVADMAISIIQGKKHRANEAIAMHALDVMQAIHESSDLGTHITLTSTCERPEPMRADLPDWVLE